MFVTGHSPKSLPAISVVVGTALNLLDCRPSRCTSVSRPLLINSHKTSVAPSRCRTTPANGCCELRARSIAPLFCTTSTILTIGGVAMPRSDNTCTPWRSENTRARSESVSTKYGEPPTEKLGSTLLRRRGGIASYTFNGVRTAETNTKPSFLGWCEVGMSAIDTTWLSQGPKSTVTLTGGVPDGKAAGNGRCTRLRAASCVTLQCVKSSSSDLSTTSRLNGATPLEYGPTL
ncbi:hypothetical protein DQ04_10301010 [Trypanosoma grayi]|uniref:hypothetical protein n=1 Tax=Trypanosoma grayi TaxID=71804 RepID=UPI0004F45206|nr:hypothetical protein DQ04_10301010 [Trypanosoma grayi]KEG07283.1 hypothetical protein DQ04_10301010 [Trypanosoma grayi]